jgi:hypothetical protein
MERRKQSILKQIYVRAVALRKLNDNPEFNKSLDPSIEQAFTAITLDAARPVLSSGTLTDEEKIALNPTMAFSWIYVGCYQQIFELAKQAEAPVDWQFPDSATPAEKRAHMLKELQFVAAQIKPCSLEFQGFVKSNPKIEDLRDRQWESSLLRDILCEMVSNAAGIDTEKRSIHHWLRMLDPDAEPEHVPLETLVVLRFMREKVDKSTNVPIFQEKQKILTAMDKLIREFEEHTDRTKQPWTLERDDGVSPDDLF